MEPSSKTVNLWFSDQIDGGHDHASRLDTIDINEYACLNSYISAKLRTPEDDTNREIRGPRGSAVSCAFAASVPNE